MHGKTCPTQMPSNLCFPSPRDETRGWATAIRFWNPVDAALTTGAFAGGVGFHAMK